MPLRLQPGENRRPQARRQTVSRRRIAPAHPPSPWETGGRVFCWAQGRDGPPGRSSPGTAEPQLGEKPFGRPSLSASPLHSAASNQASTDSTAPGIPQSRSLRLRSLHRIGKFCISSERRADHFSLTRQSPLRYLNVLENGRCQKNAEKVLSTQSGYLSSPPMNVFLKLQLTARFRRESRIFTCRNIAQRRTEKPLQPPFSPQATFPRLRSGHRLFQRPSRQKQIPWRQPKP